MYTYDIATQKINEFATFPYAEARAAQYKGSTVDGDILYGTHGDSLDNGLQVMYSLNLTTKNYTELKRFRTYGHFDELLIHNGHIFIVASEPDRIIRYNLTTKDTLSVETKLPDNTAPEAKLMVFGDKLLFVSRGTFTTKGGLYALDPMSMTIAKDETFESQCDTLAYSSALLIDKKLFGVASSISQAYDLIYSYDLDSKVYKREYTLPGSFGVSGNLSVTGDLLHGGLLDRSVPTDLNAVFTYNTSTAAYTHYPLDASGLKASPLFVVSTTSSKSAIDELKTGQELSLYPNPCTDIIAVKTNEPTQINVYDISGRLRISSSKSTLNTSDLEPGMYVATVKKGNAIYSRKFVKQ